MGDSRLALLLRECGLPFDTGGVLDVFAVAGEAERALATHVSKALGAPVAVLSESVVDLSAVGLLSAELMRQHVALPITADDDTLVVVVLDADDGELAMRLAYESGRRVSLLAGVPGVLEEWIERAIAGRLSGASWLTGPNAPNAQVAHVARARPISDDAANALAREIAAALDEVPNATPVGTVRLKKRAVRVLAAERRVVLVVDDDAAIRQMLRDLFEHDGLVVVEAATGAEAARVLDEVKIDVCVLDAMLPGIHGFEVCRTAKTSALKNLPIVMMSAVYRGWMNAREIQEVHGADFFFEKPLQVNHLRKVVGDALGRTVELDTPSAAADDIDEAERTCRQLIERGLHRGALAAVEAWLKLAPFDASGWLERGLLHRQLAEDVKAMSALELAVAYDSTSFRAHAELASVYTTLGFQRRAGVMLRRAVQLAPGDETRRLLEERLRPT